MELRELLQPHLRGCHTNIGCCRNATTGNAWAPRGAKTEHIKTAGTSITSTSWHGGTPAPQARKTRLLGCFSDTHFVGLITLSLRSVPSQAPAWGTTRRCQTKLLSAHYVNCSETRPAPPNPAHPRSSAIHPRTSRPTPRRHQLSPGPAEIAWREHRRGAAGGGGKGGRRPASLSRPRLAAPCRAARPAPARPLTGDLHAGLGRGGGGHLPPLLVLLLTPRRPRRCAPSSLQSRRRAGAAPGFGPALPLHGGGGCAATVGAKRPASSPPCPSPRASGCPRVARGGTGSNGWRVSVDTAHSRRFMPLHAPSPPRPRRLWLGRGGVASPARSGGDSDVIAASVTGGLARACRGVLGGAADNRHHWCVWGESGNVLPARP